jgi:hypothetical protein
MGVNSRVSVTQVSTNTSAEVVGSKLSAWQGLSMSYTIVNSGDDTLSWIVYGANSSDLSDKVIVNASADVLSDGASSYSVFVAPFSFYVVYIKSKVDDTPGTAVVNGIVKG